MHARTAEWLLHAHRDCHLLSCVLCILSHIISGIAVQADTHNMLQHFLYQISTVRQNHPQLLHGTQSSLNHLATGAKVRRRVVSVCACQCNKPQKEHANVHHLRWSPLVHVCVCVMSLLVTVNYMHNFSAHQRPRISMKSVILLFARARAQVSMRSEGVDGRINLLCIGVCACVRWDASCRVAEWRYAQHTCALSNL